MRFTLYPALILCVGMTTVVHTYKIDQSCRTAGIYDTVEASLHLAFDMARAGKQALQTGWDQNDIADVTPARPVEVQNLIKNVFAHDDIINDNTPALESENKWKYRMTIANLKLFKVYDTLENILERMARPGAVDDPVNVDVWIYCDGSRLEFSRSKVSVKDNDRGGIRMGSGLDSVYECSKGSPTLSGQSIAVTWGYPKAPGEEPALQYSAAIQLCKSTVENLKNGIFDERGHWSNKFLQNRMDGKKGKTKYGFKPIDGFNLLAVTLLHEMTHARGAINGEHGTGLNDVKVPTHFLPFGPSFVPAYRWDRIKVLAKRKPYVERRMSKAPDNNADSVAYFALGCWLMSREKDPMIIRDDGGTEKIEDPVTFQ